MTTASGAGPWTGNRRVAAALGLALAFLACVAAIDAGLVEIGSARGLWVFPVIRRLDAGLLAMGAAAAVFAVLVVEAGLRFIDRRPATVLAALVLVAFMAHLALRTTYPVSIGYLLASDVCTGFHSVALAHPASEILSRFAELAPGWPNHVHTNLPGKLLLFDALQAISRDPQLLAVMMVLLSDLGALLLYAVAVRWTGSRRAALVAAALYLAFPARIGFFPQPNTVSPLPIFGALLLLMQYLDSRRAAWLVALGAALYAATLFDPLVLSLGIVFAGFLAHRHARGELRPADLAKIAVLMPLGFAVAWLAVLAATGFELFAAFEYALDDLARFNEEWQRPYGLWVIHNTKEFLVTAGILASVAVLAGFARVCAEAAGDVPRQGLRTAVSRLLASPGASLVLFTVLNVVALVLIGINRGETTRLWIFLSAAVQLPAAWLLVERHAPAVRGVVVGSAAFQAAVTVPTIGFMIC